MNERQKLLQKFQEANFAVVETVLYLDTHPGDKSALACYDQYVEMRDAAMKAYTEKFGPLENLALSPSDRFSWVDNPWPWEVDA